jgi:hypothetical protein
LLNVSIEVNTRTQYKYVHQTDGDGHPFLCYHGSHVFNLFLRFFITFKMHYHFRRISQWWMNLWPSVLVCNYLISDSKTWDNTYE